MLGLINENCAMHAHILFIHYSIYSMDGLYRGAGALLTPSAHLHPIFTCSIRPAPRVRTRIAARTSRDIDLSFSAPQTEEITSLQNATGAQIFLSSTTNLTPLAASHALPLLLLLKYTKGEPAALWNFQSYL